MSARIGSIAMVVLMLAGLIIAAPQQRAASLSTPDALMGAALHQEEVEGNLDAAIATYKQLIGDPRVSRAQAATALLYLGRSYEKLGDGEARKTYERVTSEFADQTASAAAARARLAAIAPAVAPVGQSVRLLWSDLPRSLANYAVGSPSADGRYQSFSVGEKGDLAVLDLRTQKMLSFSNLGDDGGEVESSVVSPDGRQVAYVWEMTRGDIWREELRVLQVSGGEAARSRSVHVNQGYLGVHGWSPDSKSVVVVREVNPQKLTAQIAVVSIADGSIRVLRDNLEAGGIGGATFSPNGRYVAYHRRGGDRLSDIFVLTMDGREIPVVEAPGQDANPVWSPDGSQIVFRSDRTGSMSLWMVPVAEGTATGPASLVKAGDAPFLPLGVTRSGALYYFGGSAKTNVYTAELDDALTASAAPSIATDRYVNSNRSGAWSPDGRSLAYSALAPGGDFIRVRSVNTGEDREVPTQISITGPVKWFPDGESLLVASRDGRLPNGQVAYYRVDIANGHAELLHQTASRDMTSTRPDLSPDGTAIFYLESPGEPVRVDIDSRRVTRLTTVANPAWAREDRPVSLAVSPDGAQVAYLGAFALVVVPIAGGEPRVIVPFPMNSSPRVRADGLGLAWSPDQRHVFFVKPDGRSIWRAAVAGGDAKEIGVSMGRIRALRMHPDGRRIAFDSVADAQSELLVLENFLPRPGSAR